VTAPAWTGRTENRLATVLCRMAHDDGLGVCMDHIRQARIALDHLASKGLLNEQAAKENP
jgi:hypothetical protein